jgi:hypothetical protein
VLLVPANAALAQLGNLPKLKGCVLSGFKAAESVGERYTDMRKRVGTDSIAGTPPPPIPLFGQLRAINNGVMNFIRRKLGAAPDEAEPLLADTPGDAATDHRKKSD